MTLSVGGSGSGSSPPPDPPEEGFLIH